MTEFVDLDLPSGKLWASENEKGYYNYNKAVKKFGFSLPTKEDFEELIEHTNNYWDKFRKRYVIIGRNDNSIFLPAAGFHYGSTVDLVDSVGYYWSSTLDSSNIAYGLGFSNSYVNSTGIYARIFGFSVRLIKEK